MEGAMLFSYINTRLRDEEITLEEVCEEMGKTREEVEQELAALGYRFDPVRNKFC